MKTGFTKFLGNLSASRAAMEAAVVDFWQPLDNKIYILLSLALEAAAWLIAWLLLVRRLGDVTAALHYNTIFGIDYIGAAAQIYWLPDIGLIILALNLVLAIMADKKYKLLSQLLLIGSGILLIFINIALYTLNLINFR